MVTTPPGWPAAVRPPGTPGWERSAASWLLDQAPPEFRTYPLLRRHAVVLARFTRKHVDAQLAGAREGLAEVRTGLGDVVPPHVLDEAVELWEAEEARLVALSRAVGLVEEALRGNRFTPRL